MKKIFILGVVALFGTASCKTQCPAYSATKPATQVAAPAMASTAVASDQQ